MNCQNVPPAIPPRTAFIRVLIFSLATLSFQSAVNLADAADADTPAALLSSAEAAWNLADLRNAVPGKPSLQVHGDVEIGTALPTSESSASASAGGDGHVAVFQGGYLESEGALTSITGRLMTLCVRFRATKPDSAGEIVGWKAKGGRYAARLFTEAKDSKVSLVAELATDANSRPLQLTAPMDALGATKWHDMILRFRDYGLQLFVDGVLVDEEWPLGSILPPSGPLIIGSDASENSLHVMIDYVALWNRALADGEVQKLSGGSENLAERELRILGPVPPVEQYWKPRGFNVNVGDCMPFYHDGTFHVFYLQDRHHHHSKWGLGAHQWAHMSTTDLKHWTHHPMAVGITDQMEGSICTGSTFFYEGTYYAFYAVRMSDHSAAQLCAATSADGIHFTKHPSLATLTEPYDVRQARDPKVFRDPNTGLFHMLVTTALVKPPIYGRGGCLAQLVSKDLVHWQQREPFILPGYRGSPECSDYFYWNGWYYLVFSNYGIAHYRMSREPLGPWLRPEVDVFDGPQASVMKTAAFTGKSLARGGIPETGRLRRQHDIPRDLPES